MNKKRIAVFIIAAQLLTLLWIPWCPKYLLKGTTGTYRAKYTRDRSSWTMSSNGLKIYGMKWTAGRRYVHLDMSYFILGVLTIYAGSAAVYLLTDKSKTSKRASEEEPDH